jgi:tetratricopeptide (TPR) repeat protein
MNFITRQGRTLLLTAVLVVVGFISVGYGQGASSLVGIWVPDGGGTAPSGFPDKMELLSDGTCILEGRSASWKTSGERLFFMNVGGSSGFAYNYNMSNSALVLINDHGQGAAYRKHRPGDKPLPTKREQEIANLMNMGNSMIKQLDERGKMYYDNGQYDKAIKDFSELIELMPESTRHYLFRGHAYKEKKDYDRAITDFTTALKLEDPNNPKNKLIYTSRGHAYKGKKDYDRAITDFTTALKLEDPNNPKNEIIYNERGYSYLEKRNYDKALADFNKAVQLAPNKANPYDSRGEAYLTMGDYDKAIADYSKALQLDPTFESAKEGLEKAKQKKQGR